MKKYALVLSLLSASLASNCMEETLAPNITFTMGSTHQGSLTCHKARLTAKAQERISQEPKVTFSLTDEKIQELQTIHTTRNQIIKSKNELFSKICDSKISTTDGASFISDIKDQEKKRDDLTRQLDLVQRSKSLQTLNKIKNKKASTKPEQDLFKYLELNQIKKKDMTLGCTILIDLNAQLYREIEAIQQFAENQINPLFNTTKNSCPLHINNVILEINALIDTLETLSQEQASDK